MATEDSHHKIRHNESKALAEKYSKELLIYVSVDRRYINRITIVDDLYEYLMTALSEIDQISYHYSNITDFYKNHILSNTIMPCIIKCMTILSPFNDIMLIIPQFFSQSINDLAAPVNKDDMKNIFMSKYLLEPFIVLEHKICELISKKLSTTYNTWVEITSFACNEDKICSKYYDRVRISVPTPIIKHIRRLSSV
jgi:hypothetical protein